MSGGLRDTREIVREEPLMHAAIRTALRDGPMTIPEIARSIGKPGNETVVWVMGMRRYGLIEAAAEPDEEGYFRYAAVAAEGQG